MNNKDRQPTVSSELTVSTISNNLTTQTSHHTYIEVQIVSSTNLLYLHKI